MKRLTEAHRCGGSVVQVPSGQFFCEHCGCEVDAFEVYNTRQANVLKRAASLFGISIVDAALKFGAEFSARYRSSITG